MEVYRSVVGALAVVFDGRKRHSPGPFDTSPVFSKWQNRSATKNTKVTKFILYSLVECLTQRRRETESAEKSQKSERKERYDKKRPENFFHPIDENNYDAN